MTYFLKKKKWMAWVVLLTFLFTSFMPSNLLAGNSVASAEGRELSESDLKAVYVYMQVVDDNNQPISEEQITQLGLTLNSHGWFTVGKLTIDNFPSALKREPNRELEKQAVSNLDKIARYENINSYLDPLAKDIGWTLRRACGANDYVTAADRYNNSKGDAVNCWHLDGVLQVSFLNKVTINYLEKGTNKSIAESDINTVAVGTKVIPKSIPIDGYRFSYSDPEQVTIEKNSKDRPAGYTINLYYTRETLDSVTLKKVDDSGKALSGATFKLKSNPLPKVNGSENEFTLPTLENDKSYTITEEAPTGYQGVGSFTLEVKADQDGKLLLESNDRNVSYDATNKVVIVKNTPKQYNLTVNHVYNGGPLDSKDIEGNPVSKNFNISINEQANDLSGTGYCIKSVNVEYANTTVKKSLTISGDKTSVTGNMPASNVEITFIYEPIQVIVPNAQIVKQDASGKPLAGAGFTFAGNTLTATSDANWYEKVAALFSSNESVANIFPIVDSNSNNFTFVFGQTYAVSETKAPAGYTGVDDFSVQLKADGTGLELVTPAPANVSVNGFTITVGNTENAAVTINYEAKTGGSVDNKQDKDIRPATGNPAGSTATAAAGYTFDGWYSDEDCTQKVSTDLKYVPSKGSESGVYEVATYYANFTANTDISYVVEYRLRDENGKKLLPDKTVTGQTMASIVNEAAEEIAGYTVDETSKTLTLAATNNKIIFFYNVAAGTGYTVERYYQNLDGSYTLFETIKDRATTTGHLAFLEKGDKEWSSSTTPGAYVFNPNAEGTVDRKIVAADGSTVLKAYFDLRVKVQYRYTDGATVNELITETDPLYKLNSTVNVPLMDGLLNPDMDFSNLWYKDAKVTDGWDFDADTINSGNVQLIDGQYVVVLYTSAKVKPLATGDVVVQKIVTGNTAPNGEVYNFTMDITATTPDTQPKLNSDEAKELNLLTTDEIQKAKIKATAEKEMQDAENAFKAHALQATTDSGLKFVMTDDQNGTLFGITSGSSVAFEYDEYTAFTFYGTEADESLLEQVINFFKGLAGRPDKASLAELDKAVVTSGSALSFHLTDADELYLKHQALQSATKEYDTAAGELHKFQVNHGLIPSDVKVQVTDQNGDMKEYTLGKDIQADENGVYTLTFGLRAGDSHGFKFIAATGSAITFDIHENYSNDSDNFLGTNIALGNRENVIAENSQSILNGTTGSQYIFINNFRNNSGDGGDPTDPERPTNPDPEGPDIDIEDPDVPLAEPDVDEPDIEIEDPDVPLTDVPGDLVEIDEPEVPLGDAPRTGDSSNAIPFVVLMMVAGIGLVITRRKFN